MAEIDENGDGKISFEEFMEMMTGKMVSSLSPSPYPSPFSLVSYSASRLL